jgi:hypothetical protein
MNAKQQLRWTVMPFVWAGVLGGAAFMSLFFGLILLDPESNLGPIMACFSDPWLRLRVAYSGSS